ncbi:MAG TPA: hypothetical protein VG308_20730 [Stellaceae bacterium]|jgi:hypothetical protein|nr:hypothetical protein [Stellaceae bacterium]
MSIDTLAYSKTLESAGLDRKAAEAHAEALTHHILPELVTKSDLSAAKTDIEQAIARLENRMDLAIERAEHRTTLRVIGIVAAFDAALFALLRFVH